MERLQFKCLFMGDRKVGKTMESTLMTLIKLKGMLYSFVNQKASRVSYIPSTFESSEVLVNNGSKLFSVVECVDAEFAGIKRISYNRCEVFVICFSIAEPKTLENALNHWYREVNGYNVPLLLCGCKSDLRDDPDTIKELKKQNLSPVTFTGGLEITKKMNFSGYVECSSFSKKHVNDVFKTVCEVWFKNVHSEKTLYKKDKENENKKNRNCEVINVERRKRMTGPRLKVEYVDNQRRNNDRMNINCGNCIIL